MAAKVDTRRFRAGFKTWLDLSNPLQAQVAQQIAELKKTRSFAKAFREGIAIWYDVFVRRSADTLLQLAPFIEDVISSRALQAMARVVEIQDERIRYLEAQIDELRKGGLSVPQFQSPRSMEVPAVAVKLEQIEMDGQEVFDTFMDSFDSFLE